MLGLKFETSTSWAIIAEDNLEQILTDHAFAEQKASANAISIIINYFIHFLHPQKFIVCTVKFFKSSYIFI